MKKAFNYKRLALLLVPLALALIRVVYATEGKVDPSSMVAAHNKWRSEVGVPDAVMIKFPASVVTLALLGLVFSVPVPPQPLALEGILRSEHQQQALELRRQQNEYRGREGVQNLSPAKRRRLEDLLFEQQLRQEQLHQRQLKEQSVLHQRLQLQRLNSNKGT